MQTLELVHRSQWATLVLGDSVGVVSFGGHRIGLSVREALSPSTGYPSDRAAASAVFAWLLGGAGLALLLTAVLWPATQRWRRPTLWLPATCAALVLAPACAAAAWLWWCSPQISGWVGAAVVPAVALLVWLGVTRAGGYRPGTRATLPALAPLAVIAVAILLVDHANSRPRIAPVDCAGQPGHIHPDVGRCRTGFADLAAALVPSRIGTTAVAGPSCGGRDPSGYDDLTAVGLTRALRADRVRSGVLPRTVADAYGWLAGMGAREYVAALHAGHAHAIVVAAVYPNTAAAERAARADSPRRLARYLGQMGVSRSLRFRVVLIANTAIFELDPSPQTTGTIVRRQIETAVVGCSLMRVVRTPPARDAVVKLGGNECGRVGGLTPVGLARDLRSDHVPADVWGPEASRAFGRLVGTGASRYVTSGNPGAVPVTGLFVIGVYPSAAAARAAWNRIGREPGVGAYLARFDLPGSSRYQSLNDSDNLVMFQLFGSTHLDQVVVEDVVNDGSACVV